MLDDDHIEEIRRLLELREWLELRIRLKDIPVQDIADCLENMEQQHRVFLFRLLPRERSAEVFAYLDPEMEDALLNDLTTEETRHLLTSLPADDRTALLQELPAQVTQRLLNFLPPADLRQARVLLGYPPESVGRLMSPDYVAVRRDWTVGQALEHIRRHAEEVNIDLVYVTDPGGRLRDALTLKQLVLADPAQAVEKLMDDCFISLSAFDDREKAVQTIQHYDLTALPVVDSDGVLLGVVTIDDVMDVAEEEITEDFHKMGTVGVVRGNVRDASPLLLYRKRVGWLVVLVLANLFTAVGIAYFEGAIEAVIALVFFMPLIIASGGNAGAQASTLMVRALATGDARLKDWGGLLGKELAVSSALGTTMGLIIWSIGLVQGGAAIGATVALSMICVVVMGSMVGMILPFVLSKFKLDPATASAPLITSLADIFGVLIYFSIATVAMGLDPPWLR